MRRKHAVWIALALAATLALAAHAALAGGIELVVVRPGGPSPSDEAQANVNQMMKQIAAAAGWPAASASAAYFNREDEAIRYIQAHKPAFALVTPGIYLKYRAKLGLAPVTKLVMSNSSTTKFYVIAKKGGAASLADLKGKTLAGASLYEPDFVQRIVFENALTLGKDAAVRAMSGLPALKALRAGEVGAVVLDQKEYDSLGGLPYASEFATIFTSNPIPITGIMAVGKNATAAQIDALGKACANFCASDAGKGVCDTFDITGFAPASAADYADMVARYGK